MSPAEPSGTATGVRDARDVILVLYSRAGPPPSRRGCLSRRRGSLRRCPTSGRRPGSARDPLSEPVGEGLALAAAALSGPSIARAGPPSTSRSGCDARTPWAPAQNRPSLRSEPAAGGGPARTRETGRHHGEPTAGGLRRRLTGRGPVTFYAWDDWTSDFNRPHLVPDVEQVVFRGARQATACMRCQHRGAGADRADRPECGHPERHGARRVA